MKCFQIKYLPADVRKFCSPSGVWCKFLVARNPGCPYAPFRLTCSGTCLLSPTPTVWRLIAKYRARASGDGSSVSESEFSTST